MKKKLYLIFIILTCLQGFAQDPQAQWILNSQHNGYQSYDYNARDLVHLKNGFAYKPQGGAEFSGEIDPHIIVPVDYETDPIIVEERKLDKTLPVGSTIGSHSVSLTGAATYNIPIVIPPGTAGMEPNLSIAYNSQAGNGLLGIGWNLTGMSSITRVGKTYYHDNQRTSVRLNQNDRFVLDGKRLINITGNYWDVGCEYYTESFNGMLITSKGWIGNGPESFIVQTKDGHTIEYGISGNSRLTPETTVHTWLIEKITDQYGNYIKYTYEGDNYEKRINRIDYTGNENNSLSPYNKIEFFYSERSDKNHSFEGGKQLNHNTILDRLAIKSNGKTFRIYDFKYINDFYTKLIEVIEFNCDGLNYNSTIFEYGQNVQEFSQDHNLAGSISDLRYYFLDWTGDGKSDLVKFNQEDKKVKYYENANGVLNYILEENVDQRCEMLVPGDFNSDGLTDFIELDSDISGHFSVFYRKATGNPSLFIRQRVYTDYDNALNVSDFGNTRVGDINGNGIPELILIRTNTPPDDRLGILVIELDADGVANVIAQNSSTEGGIPMFYIKDIHITDFNGDGKSEILLLSEDHNHTPKTRLFDNIFMHSLVASDLQFPTSSHRILAGDFNGDGRTDIITNDINSSDNWELHFSMGAFSPQFIPGVAPVLQNLPDPHPDHNYIVADYNGDGKSDVAEVHDTGATKNLKIHYSNGVSFIASSSSHTIWDGSHYDPYVKPNHSNPDLDGDGIHDIYFKSSDINSAEVAVYPNKDDKSNKIHSIANGYNYSTKFSYEPLTSNIYTKYYDAYSTSNGEVFDFEGAFYVVSEIKTDNGIAEEIYSTTYNYEGARIHRLGKGFLGFKKIEKEVRSFSNNTYNTISKTVSTFDNLSPHYNFVKTGIEIYSGETNTEDATYLNNTISDYGDENSLIYLSYESKVTKTNLIKNQVETISKTCDSWGNTLSLFIDYNGEGSKKITSTFTKQNGACDKTLVDFTTIIQQRNGEDDYIRKIDYQYNSNGLPEFCITDPGKEKSMTTYYHYNSYGNLDITETSSPGTDSRLTSYYYDSRNRFITKSTNPLGHETSFEYEPLHGNIIETTDPNGLISSYEYDSFGRLVKSTNPDGTYIEEKIEWYDDDKDNILYFTESKPNYEPGRYVYYDKLNRERIVCDGTTIEGKRIFNETVYNSNGLIDKVSIPYLEGSLVIPGWTYHYYDSQNRVDYIDYPGYQVDYTYNGSTVKVYRNTPSGYTLSFSEKTHDAMGLVTSVTDNGGTIYYSYESSWQPREIKLGTTKTIISYDEYGFQDTLTDPDAGILSFEYNAYGELVWQKDANGNKFNMTYDLLGRIEAKSCLGGPSISYQYDTKPNSIGLLTEVTGLNVIYDYNYDALSRLINETETISGTDFTTTYRYCEESGRLDEMVYPSGISLDYTYSNGHLQGISNSGNLLHKTVTTNARGQIESCEKGSLYTTYSYDSYGYPVSINTSTHPEGIGDIQDLQYSFAASTGNLYYRKDVKNNLNEYFVSYDNLNRLKTSAINSQTATVSYYDNGNIYKKQGVGDYKYDDNNKPHAVRNIDNPVNTENITQDISYTVFNKVGNISHPELENQISFYYGPDFARKKTDEIKKGAAHKTKIFVGDHFEKILDNLGNVNELNYVYGPDGLTAIIVIDRNATPETSVYFIHKDHLGSYHTITDINGNIVETLSFDAWGNRRNHLDGTYTNLPTSFLFDRGFTGHEHLDNFGLINMNGRVYDPVLSRFLSPDSYVQAPGFSQSFNRYSYAFNNPLVYIDPDGNIAWVPIVVAAVVGAVVDYGIQVAVNHMMGDRGYDAWLGNIDYFDIGVSALTSGMSYGGGLGASVGGKVARYMAKHPSLVVAAEVFVTSAVDITGNEGFKPVSFNDFSQRVTTGIVSYKASQAVGKLLFPKFKSSTKTIEQRVDASIEAAKQSSQILGWGKNAKGHLIKHADALGFGEKTPQQLQKMLPELRSAANQLLNNANPALTRVGQWHQHSNAIMRISNGKMLVTQADGTFITVINKTSNNWYNLAKPLH